MRLAWKNIMDRPMRLMAGALAIAAVVALMFMQMGFLYGFDEGNLRLLESLNCDLMIVSARKETTLDLMPFSWRRVYAARGVDGVAWAEPVYVRMYEKAWRDVKTGKFGAVRVIGVDPGSKALDGTGLEAVSAGLATPDTVIFDESSRDFVARPEVGQWVELCGRRMRATGYFRLGTDIDANANVVVGTETFERCYHEGLVEPGARPDPEYVVVKLAAGADAEEVKRAIQKRLPMDTVVRTRAEVREIELDELATETPLAPLLSIGVVIGFVVGVVIVANILFNEVTDRLNEYAVLKAVGQSDGQVGGVVMWQGVIYSVAGFLPGFALALAGYRWLEALCTLPMRMEWGTVALIAGLTLAMCLMAGWLAVRRGQQVDPAELF